MLVQSQWKFAIDILGLEKYQINELCNQQPFSTIPLSYIL